MTFDIEKALAEVARRRAVPDPVTRETAKLADKVADGARRDFGAVWDMEATGKAFIVAAASVLPLVHEEGMPAAVIANLIALAGENLVREARRG